MKIIKLILLFVISFYVLQSIFVFGIFLVRFNLDRKIIDHKEFCAQNQAIFEAKHTVSDLQTPEYKNIKNIVEDCLQQTSEEKILAVITSQYIYLLIPAILSLSISIYVAKKMK